MEMCQEKDEIIQKLQAAVEDATRDVSPLCNAEETSFRMLHLFCWTICDTVLQRFSSYLTELCYDL